MKKLILILIVVLIGLFLLIDNGEEKAPKLVEPEELREISSSVSDFSFSIFNILANEEENLFISPYSIHSALGIAYLGAKEETQKEIAKVLHIADINEAKIKTDFLLLKQYLENISDQTEVNIANALFLKEEIPFLETFKSDGKNYFEAEIDKLPEEGKTINDWVYQKTNQKIEEIIDSGPIPGNTISYLINAIYFKGLWQEEFDSDKTSKRMFNGIERKTVDMMENSGNYSLLVEDDLVATTLEYKDAKYLFHIIMPEELNEFYEEFNYSEFQRIKNNMTKRDIVLKIPKFKLEKNMNLNEVLQSLGIQKAFSSAEADFSGMVNLQRLDENVYIGDVLHSTFIEIDEKGAEAAAVTSVEMRTISLPMPVEFNNPFIFLIENSGTETILFLGQVVDIN